MAASSSQNHKNAAIFKEMVARRNLVADAIQRVAPAMRDRHTWAKRVGEEEQAVFKKLFDEVHQKSVADNYVAWMVNCQLWLQYHQSVRPQFRPEFFDKPPNKFMVGPYCGKFRDYQYDRAKQEQAEQDNGLTEDNDLARRQEPKQTAKPHPKSESVSSVAKALSAPPLPRPKPSANSMPPHPKPAQHPSQSLPLSGPPLPRSRASRPKTSETERGASITSCTAPTSKVQDSLNEVAEAKKRKRERAKKTSPTHLPVAKKVRGDTELRADGRRVSSAQENPVAATLSTRGEGSVSTQLPLRTAGSSGTKTPPKEPRTPSITSESEDGLFVTPGPEKSTSRSLSTHKAKRTSGANTAKPPRSRRTRQLSSEECDTGIFANQQASSSIPEPGRPAETTVTETFNGNEGQSSSTEAQRRSESAADVETPRDRQERPSSTKNPKRSASTAATETSNRNKRRSSSSHPARRTTNTAVTEHPRDRPDGPSSAPAPRHPATTEAAETPRVGQGRSSSTQAPRRPTSRSNPTETPTATRQEDRAAASTAAPAPTPEANPARPDLFQIARRLQRLSTNDIPPNPRDWARFTWQALYGQHTPPPPQGDYFALPLREGWIPLVSAAVLMRAHKLLDAVVRVEVRDGGMDNGEGKMLAVTLSGQGDPTSVYHLCLLMETWVDLREWHRHMVVDDFRYPLDEFLRENLAQKLAIKVAKTC